MRIQPFKQLCTALALALVLSGAALTARAQLQIGPAGLSEQAFGALPPVTSWSFRSTAGVAGDITTQALMDAQVQTNTAALINNALVSTAGTPPAASANWMFASDGLNILARPTGNRFTILLATLQNTTGSNITAVTVGYDLGISALVAEELLGHSVYYSTSGLANSWTRSVSLSGAQTNLPTNRKTDTIPVGTLPNNALFYLLWTDDNGSGSPDIAFTIDNFVAGAIPSAPAITNQPQSTSVAPAGSVTFTVGANGAAPFTYRWLKGGAPILNATNSSYNIASAVVGDAGNYSVIVSNIYGIATSSNAVLTVVCSTPVSIASQPQNQSLNSGGTISLSVGVVGTSPYAYQWYRNGAALLNATNSTYSRINAAPADSGLYTVSANNCIGVPATSTNAVVSVADPGFISLGLTNQSWKYDQSGGDLGTAWQATGYNDTAWSSGLGVLAFENQAVINPLTNTVLSLSNAGSQVITYYFRTHFNFTNDPALVSLISSNYIDDGMVVYLNGQEAFRYNMPAGNIAFSTLAPVANPAGEGVPISTNLPSSLLVQGDNVLAVEVHQNSATSSDIVFGMALIVSPYPPSVISLTSEPQSVTVFETQPASFTVGVQGQPTYFQWYRNDVAVTNGTTNPLSIPIVSTNDAGLYYVVVTNVINSVTSSVVTLTVLPDTNGPVIIEADGTASMTNILISFNERINATNGTNIANFAVNNTQGGSLTILRATVVNGTNVLLHTSARTSGANYLVVVNNVRDISPRANLIAPNSRYPVRSLVSLLTLGSTWRVYDPYEAAGDASNLGTTWKEFAYTETNAWASFNGIIYNGQDETDLPAPVGSPGQLSQTDTITTYFRTPFTLVASPGGLQLLVRHVMDDGGVIYLNGTEVLRRNLPTGTINYLTPATVAVDPIPLVGPISIPIDSYRLTNNVIAAELHQNVAVDVDKAFGLQLDASVQSFVVGPVVITSGAEDVTAYEGGSATFTVIQAGGQTFQWQSNSVNITGATNSSYTVPFVTTNMNGRLFRAGVSSPVSGLVFSTNGTLRVLGDTNRPVLLSGRLNASNNTIVLAFSELMATAPANTIGNYTVTNAAGASATVTGAALSNGTNVTLSFSAPLAGRYTVVVNNLTDLASNPNAILPNSAVTVGADYAIAMNSGWKYLQINTNATVQSTFMASAFDDSSWQGPSNALLYVEESALPGPKNTLLGLTDIGGNVINTYYFRQRFYAPIGGTNVTLRLSHIIDDGMVLHLNGVEVYRFNMPAGVPGPGTQAAANVGNAILQGPFDVTLTNFIGGTNIFAVEVHQQGAASSDVVMGIEMSLSVPSFIISNTPCVSPQITTQPASRTNGVGTVAVFSVAANGTAPLQYQWRRSSTNLVGATNSTYSIASVQLTDAGTYSVLASNACGTQLSSNAVLTVTNTCTIIAYTLPRLNLGTNGTNVVLSWSNPTTNSCGSNAIFRLQATLALSNNPAQILWSNLTNASPYVTPKTNATRFFRLISP